MYLKTYSCRHAQMTVIYCEGLMAGSVIFQQNQVPVNLTDFTCTY